ncbi:MAG: hypothetical protein H0V16_03105 [Burkholderiaceae bacterium]|nr:hypothetical protein [Burkholderiaceae bacterium]
MKVAVLIGALFGFCAGAFAAAGVTLTTVDALSPVVTYSRPANPPRIAALTTFVGAGVTVANTSGNTINNVVFEAKVEVADPHEIVSFSSVDGATCQVTSLSGNPLTITCELGQLRARESRRFTLFFTAPMQDGVSPLPDGSDYVGLSGRVTTAEGPNAGKSPNDSVDYWPLSSAVPAPFACPGPSLENPSSTTHWCVRVDLGTPSTSQVKSAVSKSGGMLFTGEGGVTGLIVGDAFTTSVSVPSSQIITKATVVEDPLSTCTNFLTCYSSNIQIIDAATAGTPADFSPAYLTIVLRMDAANIKKGTNINSVTIMYYDGVTRQPVGDCGSATTPLGNGKPCIAKRTAYKSNYRLNPDLQGDFEWEIINTKNGVFEFF